MALRRLEELCLACKISSDFEQATNLHLMSAKSIIRPTLFKLSDWNLDMLRAWLRRNVPRWVGLVVRSPSKFLGFCMGPIAGGSQWTAPAEKYADRVIGIRDMRILLRLAVAQHNYYAFPVLGYVAQLAVPPPRYSDLTCLPF